MTAARKAAQPCGVVASGVCMRRVLASLILLPLAACGPTNADFDLRLREMAGTNERGLLGIAFDPGT